MEQSAEKKPTLTLTQLQRSTEKAKKTAVIDYTHPLLRGLAVMARYDESTLSAMTGELSILAGEPVLDHVDKISGRITVAGKTWYFIRDQERKTILSLIDTADAIKALVRHYVVYMDIDHVTQQAFNAHVLESDLPMEQQTMPQLLASYTVIDWLKQTPIPTHKADAVLGRIKHLELLQPFKRLTGSFSGRQKELAELSDYVDWLPKKNARSLVGVFFRSITSMNERPPLMITGIGGIGKSTLIARFILQQLESGRNGQLPFVYFDFDKSGLSIENLNGLAYDAMTQLAYQFPDQAPIFNEIAEYLKSTYFDLYEGNTSRGSDRRYFFETFIQRHAEHLNSLKLPILIVFDSFEEVQTRYPRTVLFNLFDFLSKLSEQLPRLRIVFVSRSEFTMSNIKFETYQMPAFDKASAVAYLGRLEIADPVFAASIYDQFGGNPLTLQLAAGFLKKEGYSNKKNVLDIEIRLVFSKIAGVQVQEQLVQRNLNHIKNDKVRRIAVPGILVRRIDADVIRQVLAKPCGLGAITKDEAVELYNELEKESFLLNDIGGSITFRQDLRLALAPLIESDPSYQSLKIHEAAIAYYSGKTSPEDVAEFLYHTLMSNGDPAILDGLYNKDVGFNLSNSVLELPIDAFVYLAAIAELNVPEDKLKKASLFAWERYMEAQIQICLRIGDEGALMDIRFLLGSRKEIPSRHFSLREAKLFERLGDFITSEQLLSRFDFSTNLLSWPEQSGLSDWLLFVLLRTANQEYQCKFEEATKMLDQSLLYLSRFAELTAVPYATETLERAIAILFKSRRLYPRRGYLENPQPDFLRQILVLWFDTSRPPLYGDFNAPLPVDEPDLIRLAKTFPQPYEAAFLFKARNKQISSVEQFLDGVGQGALSEKDFVFRLDQLRSQTRAGNKTALEGYLVERYNVYLKDICEPGIYDINVIDVLLFEEAAAVVRSH
jgi:hypothetical protein